MQKALTSPGAPAAVAGVECGAAARHRTRPLVLAYALVVLTAAQPGCAFVLRPFRGPPPPLIEVAPDALPSFADDLDGTLLGEAIQQSMAYFRRQPDATFVVAGRAYSGAQYLSALGEVLETLPGGRGTSVFDEILRSRFRVFKATGQGQRIRFTGYYTPRLDGALSAGGPYQYPLYGRPPDLLNFDVERIVPGCDCATGVRAGRLENGVAVPYYTRAEIDGAGALRNRGLEIAWTDDPVALFFLHIQGSGQLLLPDGRHVHVNYAATNGRPFRSIGTLLAKRGELPQGGGSMQAMRSYLESHPEEQDAILHENPRYTFFRLEEDGPFGSTQVKLTPGRSIATDPAIFPPGSLAYIRTEVPVVDPATEVVRWAPVKRLVLNQDKGAAIKGPARVDIYFGNDEGAEAMAGRMSATGDLYFLVPRAGAPTPSRSQEPQQAHRDTERGSPRRGARRPAASAVLGPQPGHRTGAFRYEGERRIKTLLRPMATPERLPIRYLPG